MKLFELFQPIVEGYKEAQTDFEKSADAAAVKTTIDAYRQLVNKNQYQGNERNIDYWRKQGWDAFSKSVKELSGRPTKTAVKRSKPVGKSITLGETAEWLIVIPIDKTASCFHGKGADWCTAKPFAHYYEDYFYKRNVTLIYFIGKTTGDKLAIAVPARVNHKIEFFNKEDRRISQNDFDRITGLKSQDYINRVQDQDTQDTMAGSKQEYKTMKAIIKKKGALTKVNPKVEEALLYVKDPGSIIEYCANAKGRWPEAERLLIRSPEHAAKYATAVIGDRWPESERFIAKDAPSILDYASVLPPGEQLPDDLENAVISHILDDKLDKRTAIFEKLPAYVDRAHNGRWPELEELIVKDPRNAKDYAELVLHARWPEAEKYIKTDPQIASYYASSVIKGRWPEAEPDISTDPYAIVFYARDVLKSRWPEQEENIKSIPDAWGYYKSLFGIKGK